MSRKSTRPLPPSRDNSATAYRLADYLGETSTPLAGHGISSSSQGAEGGSFEQVDYNNGSFKPANSVSNTTNMGDSPDGTEDIGLDDPPIDTGKVRIL